MANSVWVKEDYLFPRYIPGIQTKYDFTDKDSCAANYFLTMINRCQSMMKYTGLPKTIPERMFKLYLHTNGNCVVTRVNDELYAFTGGLGGEPDVYYQPTLYTVANPYLDFSKSLEIDVDCVLIRNDSLMLGIIPLLRRYITELVEADITLDMALVNLRSAFLISASDDVTKMSGDKYLKDIRDGKQGVIAESSFLEDSNLRVQPGASGNSRAYITQVIEAMQYVKASMLQDIGLQSGHNMKREYIGSDETQLNEDSLRPFIDDMLETQRECLTKLNEMYDLNVQVELSSSWADKYIIKNTDSVQTENNSVVDEIVTSLDDSETTNEDVDDSKTPNDVVDEEPDTDETVIDNPETVIITIVNPEESEEDVNEELDTDETN